MVDHDRDGSPEILCFDATGLRCLDAQGQHLGSVSALSFADYEGVFDLDGDGCLEAIFATGDRLLCVEPRGPAQVIRGFVW